MFRRNYTLPHRMRSMHTRKQTCSHPIQNKNGANIFTIIFIRKHDYSGIFHDPLPQKNPMNIGGLCAKSVQNHQIYFQCHLIVLYAWSLSLSPPPFSMETITKTMHIIRKWTDIDWPYQCALIALIQTYMQFVLWRSWGKLSTIKTPHFDAIFSLTLELAEKQ